MKGSVCEVQTRPEADVTNGRRPYALSMNDTPAPIRLLIVDDNATARAATIALLEATPHRVDFFEASDGAEAVRLAASLQPDVILMDVRMPRLDGIAATRRIKQRWPAMRVVVLTLVAAHRDAALAAGADAFLLKDGALEKLLTAVF